MSLACLEKAIKNLHFQHSTKLIFLSSGKIQLLFKHRFAKRGDNRAGFSEQLSISLMGFASASSAFSSVCH